MDSTTPAAASANSSGNWLGSQSIFDKKDERKLGRAMLASLISHGGLLALLVAGFGLNQVVQTVIEPPLEADLVFLKAPGPGGGGGGSPQPAPAKKLEVPKPKAVEPVPTPVPPPVVPPPTLNAPVQTSLAQVLQATGTSSISTAPVGGGGSGGGIGAGRGNGLGEGSGGGTGGGEYKPGAGVSWPTELFRADPSYTSEAMRAKIQGTVKLSAVVLPNGTVGEVKILRSLDRQYGLDQAAIDAAKKWRFNPCKLERENRPVPCGIEMELEFRLH
jgi:protein TonB